MPTSVGRRSPWIAGDLGRELAGGGRVRAHDLAVDARDVDPAAVEVVRDAAAGRELGVAGLDHAQLDLVLLAELLEQRDHPRVDVAAAHVLLRVGVEHDVLVLEQRGRGRLLAAAAPACGLDRGGRRRCPGGGLDRRGRCGRRRRGGGRVAGLGQQPLGLLEPQLVAAAVLLGGALDVGDPLAELVRVGDGLAAREPLLLDALGGVEEPLGLQLGLLGEAGVLALVPDPDAHLEEADRVGVAEVEVLDARLDERRHHRQLLGQPALLCLAAEPGGELLLRRVVAGIRVGPARRPRRRRPPRRAAPLGGGAAAAAACGCAGWTAANAPDPPFLALAASARAAMNCPDAPFFGAGGGTAAAAAAGAGAGATPAAGAAAGTAAAAAGAAGAGAAPACAPPAATSAGGVQLLSISCLKPTCTWSWWPASVK